MPGGGGDVDRVLAIACGPAPTWDPVVYLADYSLMVLYPVSQGVAEEYVAGTMAGRAFTTEQPVTGG